MSASKWDFGGHHINWYPDGRHLSMNLGYFGNKLRLVRGRYDGALLEPIRTDVLGSGHPTIHPDGRHLLTDSYLHEPTAFGDGTVPIRWVDLETGQDEYILRIPTNQSSGDETMRVDPHPAWNNRYDTIALNCTFGGQRHVLLADMSSKIGANPATHDNLN